MKKYIIASIILLGMYSCSNDTIPTDDEASTDALSIGSVAVSDEASSTRSAGNPFTSSASNTGWSTGDQMGIWCINTELAHFKIHSDLACSNTVVTYTTAGWDIDGNRRRLNSPYLAAMFAYYPYVQNYATTDKEVTVDSIPVCISEQHDILYGSNLHADDATLSRAMNIAYNSDLINSKTTGILSNKNMRADLYMHHATALIEFRVRRRSYSGLGVIDRAEMNDEENKFINNGILTAWFDYSDTDKYKTADGSDVDTDVKNIASTKSMPQFLERKRDDYGNLTDEWIPIDLGRIKASDYVTQLVSLTPNMQLAADTVSRTSIYFMVAPQKVKPSLKMYLDGEDNPFECNTFSELEVKAGYKYVFYGRVDGGNYLYFGEPQVAKWDDPIDIDPNPGDDEENVSTENEKNLHLQY